MKILLDIDPPRATGQMHKVTARNGKPFFYDPEPVKAARELFGILLSRHVPAQPLQGPVRLHVVWRFKARTRKQDGTYKTTRPDTDNLQKILKDEMTLCGFWNDDAQVVDERVEKKWSLTPGIEIEIEEIEE